MMTNKAYHSAAALKWFMASVVKLSIVFIFMSASLEIINFFIRLCQLS